MGIFDLFKGHDINQGVEECKGTSGAMLLDVRTKEEYREGRIPGSRNIPLDQLTEVASAVKEKATPLYVYCHSGVRSGQAASILKRMGYTNVKNIGGIMTYKGKVER